MFSFHSHCETKLFIKILEVIALANIKSAKKRILVTQTKTERNKAIKSRVKTETKKVFAAVKSGDKAAAEKQLLVATSCIDKAKSKGVYHKNTAARKISRLTKVVNNA
jgi:small subunit ribosomal protein S20